MLKIKSDSAVILYQIKFLLYKPQTKMQDYNKLHVHFCSFMPKSWDSSLLLLLFSRIPFEPGGLKGRSFQLQGYDPDGAVSCSSCSLTRSLSYRSAQLRGDFLSDIPQPYLWYPQALCRKCVTLPLPSSSDRPYVSVPLKPSNINLKV